ncbi:MAG TPA: hypothetical protein VHC72_12525, partial [Bryobacteraceae bacterium]|nr:hypothetical protein [Bryobacteraceae bacterium]
MQNRRSFVATTAGVALLASSRAEAAPSQASAWDEVPKILARIKPPAFKKRDFDITKYGAKPGDA